MRKLKVNLNYKTGRRGENNCRIVSAGSELDLMYQETYDNYLKKSQEDYERKEQERIKRDGAGEWILS